MRDALRVTDAVSCVNMWMYMANTTPGGSPIQWGPVPFRRNVEESERAHSCVKLLLTLLLARIGS